MQRSPTLTDHQQRLRLVAKQTEALAHALPDPFAAAPDQVPAPDEVARHLAALQLVQAITVKSAAELTSFLPLDPTATTAARRSAIALAAAHLHLGHAAAQLGELFHLAVGTNVWIVPGEGPQAAALYRGARTALVTAARDLRREADQLPASGITHAPWDGRRASASRTVGARLRHALRRRPAKPLPLAVLPRTAAKSPRP
ncbi:hypothetical protein [Streptacidiphilus sp. MAP5-52]|uniref:hypothetical protein n=1 Tax=Streptacidiphilus sp. MAP5-52 TaxID=3156267 RepID=UPI003519A2A0